MTTQPSSSLRPVLTRVPSFRNRKATRGFALLLVLGLLSLIVLILVSLAAFTKVETSIAGVTQQQAQARQNAIFAMNQALGLLQRSAGPDQRVTAAGNLVDPSGAPVRHNWTGVWDSNATASGPITWLVTGNDADPNYPTTGNPATLTDLTTPVPNPDTNANRDTVWMLRRALTDSSGTVPNYGAPGVVVVPKAEIVSQDVPGFVGTNRAVGRYAFWVADEGVKASLGMWDRTMSASQRNGSYQNRAPLLTYNDSPSAAPTIFSDYSPGGTAVGQQFDSLGDHNRFRTRLLIAQENRLDQFFNGIGIAGLPLEIQRSPARENLTSLAQFEGIGNSAPKRAVLRDALVANYHSLTPQSLGVLSDTINGGLKRILTIKPGTTSTFEGNNVEAQLVDWATNRSTSDASDFSASTEFMIARSTIEPPRKFTTFPGTSSGKFFFQGPADLTPFGVTDFLAPANSNLPVFLRAPIMSQIRVSFQVGDAGGGVAQIQQMEVEVELWNPYPVELQISTATSPTQLAFTLDGLSGLVLSATDASGSGTPVTIELPGAMVGPFNAVLNDLTLRPGEVVRLPVIGPVAFPAGPTSGPIVFPLTDITWPNSGMNVLMEWVTAAATLPLRLYSGIQLSDPGSAIPGDSIEFNMRLRDMTDVGSIPPGLNDWLLTYDPNSPTIRGTVGSTIGTQHPYIYPAVSAVSATGSVTGFDGGFIDGELGFCLYDVRRQDVLSYGAFRHVSFMPFDIGGPNERNAIPYAIGAPVALSASPVIGEGPGSAIASFNQGFDRLYPIAVPREELAAMSEANSPYSGSSLPNSHLQFFSKLGVTSESVATPAQTGERIRLDEEMSESGRNAAQFLMVRNSFNINSTSEAAWRALLAGADFRSSQSSAATSSDVYFRYLGASIPETAGVTAGTDVLTDVWFRFPQNVQNLRVPVTNALLDVTTYDEIDANRIGMRKLTQNQINLLAQQMVQAIRAGYPINVNGVEELAPGSAKAGNAPFGSLAQFIGSGALQRAIEAVGTISATDAINPANIPFGAPAALMQQDILERLAPILSARSDTFVIRAYGEAGNPLENPNTRAFTVGEAWLEAVVQRCPDFVDQSTTGTNAAINTNATAVDEREWSPGDAAAPSALSTVNQNLGRRFRVLSVRWLAPDEI